MSAGIHDHLTPLQQWRIARDREAILIKLERDRAHRVWECVASFAATADAAGVPAMPTVVHAELPDGSTHTAEVLRRATGQFALVQLDNGRKVWLPADKLSGVAHHG